MPPKLDAVFFATATGNEPVRDWLLRLDREERRAIGTDIAYVQWKWPLGRPRVDHLLHAFFKKSQAIPPTELQLAIARWKEWNHEEGE